MLPPPGSVRLAALLTPAAASVLLTACRSHRPSSFSPPSQRGCQCPTEEYGLESSNIPIATNTVTQVGNTIYFWPNRLGQNSDRFDFKGPTVVERN